MPRFFINLLALAVLYGCAPTAASPAPTPARRAPAAASPAPPPRFRCTEVIGLTVTAEWYGAFEQAVDDARFQARTRPHAFVEQWADPKHEAWSEPLTSACAEQPESPDRVVLFAANWTLETREAWTHVLEAFVATAKQRYPALRDLELFTVLRGPHNTSCGDPKSVVAPMIDAAISDVVAENPSWVHAGPRLEAADCSVFTKGGPHFSEEGRKLVAKQLAVVLR